MAWFGLLAFVPAAVVLVRKWRRRSQKKSSQMKVADHDCICIDIMHKRSFKHANIYPQSISISAGKLRATILNFGATVAELHVPDRNGSVADILLGFSTLDGWKSSENPCMNTIIGRTAGRCVPLVHVTLLFALY